MKKSKKALLWTIVPVLGISSGVAGAIAGVTSQKTSVDTNNVATSNTATTMATKSTSSLKIDSITSDVLTYSDRVEKDYISIKVSGQSPYSTLRYRWEVNRGDGIWKTYASTTRQTIPVDVPKNVTSVQDWTFRCIVTDSKTNSSITSSDVKFTIAPKDGIYINITEQPESSKTVKGGEKVTLKTSAVIQGNQHTNKTIGYQWFKYNSGENKLEKIDGANDKEYTFTASLSNKQKTEKYVCRYYFTSDSTKYMSESNQSIVTINKSVEEKITVSELKASKSSIKVGETTTLSVKATSNVTATENLTYQWYKVGEDDRTFELIDGATSSTYEYKATSADNNKELVFCVLVGGSTMDDVKYHLQSDNLRVKVGLSSETTGSVDSEALASKIEVSSSVTTNQASVRSTFYAVNGIKTPQYSVDVKGVESTSGLTYKWYYVGNNGKDHLIDGATSNVLTTNKSLYEKAYKDNSYHKVGIKCEIYKDGQLVKTVDQKTNSRFYMSVVITRR